RPESRTDEAAGRAGPRARQGARDAAACRGREAGVEDDRAARSEPLARRPAETRREACRPFRPIRGPAAEEGRRLPRGSTRRAARRITDMFSTSMPLARLAEMCRRVGLSLQAGIDARRAWASEAERHDGAERERLQAVNAALGQGVGLADALSGVDSERRGA